MTAYRETVCLVLRHTPYQESSLIVSGISPDAGRLDFLLKGARGLGKKKFPELGLFREVSLKFRPPERSSTLFSVREIELRTVFDSIANHTENYLTACDLSAFLQANTRPMLETPQTYRAFRILLGNYAAGSAAEPWKMLLKLAFLNENGLVPEPEGTNEEELLAHLLAASQGEEEPPELAPEYLDRLSRWVDSLLTHHGFRRPGTV